MAVDCFEVIFPPQINSFSRVWFYKFVQCLNHQLGIDSFLATKDFY